jgi:hypothetical protein
MSVFTTGKRKRSSRFYRQNHKGGHGHRDRRWPTRRNKPPPIQPTGTIHFHFDQTYFFGYDLTIKLLGGRTALIHPTADFECPFNEAHQRFFIPQTIGAHFAGIVTGWISANPALGEFNFGGYAALADGSTLTFDPG